MWDSLRNEFKGTLVLRDFLDVLFSSPLASSRNGDAADQYDEFKSHVKTNLSSDEAAESENYVKIIEEMEKNVLKNSVFHIFELVTHVEHKIMKVNHEKSLKYIWDIMKDENLKMAALESEADPENKIPHFIQGFLNYVDFLDFFIDNYEGDPRPFERTLRDLDFYYTQSIFNEGEDSVIKVIQQDEKLNVVLKKMLDFHIGMAPIVEDMEHKKTIGFFFLKDVFWLLKFGKFDFLDKSVLHLLQTIYRDNQD